MCIKAALYYFRATLSLLILGLAGVYGSFVSLVFTIIGQRPMIQWAVARFTYFFVKNGLGIEVKVIGEEKLQQKPCIIISNHQSSLDVFMLARLFPRGCTVTAKDSLKYVPLLGWYMALSGTYFLKRSSRKQSLNSLNKGLSDAKQGHRALWIFPEGTRSYTTDLTMVPFKKGAFHLAQQGKIPIIPVVVSNTSTLQAPKWSVFNKGCMIVKVLDPIRTENLKPEDVGKLAEDTRELMIKTMKELGYSPAIVETGLPPQPLEYAKRKQKEKEESLGKASGSEIHQETASVTKSR